VRRSIVAASVPAKVQRGCLGARSRLVISRLLVAGASAALALTSLVQASPASAAGGKCPQNTTTDLYVKTNRHGARNRR